MFYSFAGRAITNVEDNEWKHRRKLLSKVFNYDFIVAHIPMMITIADKVFDDLNQEAKYLLMKIEVKKVRKINTKLTFLTLW